MGEKEEVGTDAERGKTAGVKKVNKDPAAEDETEHFRRQIVRRPWDH